LEISELRTLAKFLYEEMNSQHSADNAPKFDNGKVVVYPGDKNAKEHEIPFDKFMHKIVMMRDNLRVLEQQLNSSDSLSEGEKLKFQSYITKCYGSMTSFNFLFYYEHDKFSSK
jgi:hypothetical protein